MMQDTRALDALLDRILARRRELAANVPGIPGFADVSADPDLVELREWRAAQAVAPAHGCGTTQAEQAVTVTTIAAMMNGKP